MPTDATKTSSLIDAIKRRKNQTLVVAAAENLVELVVFTLLDQFYAISGAHVKEILLHIKVNHIPGAPKNILGLINVRGDIESVLDINKILGLPPQPKSTQNRIIIIESAGFRSGILTGAVHDVLSVPQNTISPPLTSLTDNTKDFVKGETLYNSHETTLLDIEKIFKKALA